MSVRYPVATCGCTLEVYRRDVAVCRMDCPEGKALLAEVQCLSVDGRRTMAGDLPADLVSRYNAHANAARVSVGVGEDLVAPHRRYPSEEATSNPIFLVQQRMYHVHTLPDGYDFDDDYNVIDPSCDEVLSYDELVELDCAFESWETVSVWFTRAEAEGYAKAIDHRYPNGMRVYCVNAGGDLAEILKQHTYRSEVTR